MNPNEITLEQANSITQSIVTKLGYPYQIFSTAASYQEVMNAYECAMQQGRQEGFTPILVPSDDVLEEYLGILKDDGYILEDTLKTELESGEELLQKYYESYTEDMTDLEEFTGVFDDKPAVIDRISAFQRYNYDRHTETIIETIPVSYTHLTLPTTSRV